MQRAPGKQCLTAGHSQAVLMNGDSGDYRDADAGAGAMDGPYGQC